MARASIVAADPCTPRQALEHLGAVRTEKVSADGTQAHELAERGACFRLTLDGDPIASYVLRDQGGELFVSAAAGRRPGVPLVELLDLVLTAQARARGYRSIAFQTIRAGLVRKCLRLGYLPDAVAIPTIMRKHLA